MIVKPNPDKKTEDGEELKVFDPVKKKFLPEGGAHVSENTYWIRRLAVGEVIYANKAVISQPDTQIDTFEAMNQKELMAEEDKRGLSYSKNESKANLRAMIRKYDIANTQSKTEEE